MTERVFEATLPEVPSRLSDRGLRYWDPILCDGGQIKVFESSAAGLNNLWIDVQDSEATSGTYVHLSKQDAEMLVVCLVEWLNRFTVASEDTK